MDMRCLAMLTLLTAAALTAQDAPPNRLVVHEWGTFTSVAGGDGASLEWRPLSGPSDLPRFVYHQGRIAEGLRHGPLCKKCCEYNCDPQYCSPKKSAPAAIRMETPVLYFYSDRETDVEVRVGFPQGRITEWYPRARSVDHWLDWGKVKVLPGAQVELLREKEESHYYPARETDAAPVRVCGGGREEFEKFLFYRGIGTFDLPIRAAPSNGHFEIRNVGRDAVCDVILFENRGGRVRFAAHPNLADRVDLSLPETPGDLDALLSRLQKILVGQGLYEKEAHAMIETWRDSWFEEGTRVFYIVPRPVTDAILPLRLFPKPAELVRVLVGRVELITPELERAILSHVSALGDDSFDVREAATAALRRYGRFLQPVLKRARASTSDPEIQARIDELLKF
jgi:hypothetical protein